MEIDFTNFLSRGVRNSRHKKIGCNLIFLVKEKIGSNVNVVAKRNIDFNVDFVGKDRRHWQYDE